MSLQLILELALWEGSMMSPTRELSQALLSRSYEAAKLAMMEKMKCVVGAVVPLSWIVFEPTSLGEKCRHGEPQLTLSTRIFRLGRNLVRPSIARARKSSPPLVFVGAKGWSGLGERGRAEVRVTLIDDSSAHHDGRTCLEWKGKVAPKGMDP